MASNKYKRLGKNSIFVFIGNMGGKLIAFLMLPFYTRWLSVTDYGTTDLILGYSTLLYDVITFCICQSIFIFPKKGNITEKKGYLTSGLLFSILSIIIFIPIIKSVGQNILPQDNIFNTNFYNIYIMAATMFLMNYCQNFIRSIDKMKIYCLMGIMYTAGVALLSTFLIPYYGVKGYVSAMAGAAFIVSVYAIIYGKLYYYFNLKNLKWKYNKIMLGYSIPLIGNVVISFLSTFLNRPIMEEHCGLETVGTFAVVNKFSSIISTLIPIFCTAWQVSVLEEYGKETYNEFYNKTLRTLSLILISASITIIPFYDIILAIFASNDYDGAWIYIPFLTLSTVFSFWGYYTGTIFSAVQKSKYYLYSGIWTTIASLTFNFILIPYYGLWGSITATLLSQIIFAICRYLYAQKYSKINCFQKLVEMILLYTFVSITTILSNNIVIGIITALLSIFILISRNKDIYQDSIKFIYSTIKKEK